MKSVCVIGSGISGSTIANLLSKKYKVDVYEKAKGIGGRSSHRRYLNKLGFDHGLQYISPKTSKFKKFCSRLQKKRVLKRDKISEALFLKIVKSQLTFNEKLKFKPKVINTNKFKLFLFIEIIILVVKILIVTKTRIWKKKGH